MNTQTLQNLARERRCETLREAAELRRARLSIQRKIGLRARLASALVATGEKFVTLGTSLAGRSE